METRHSAPYRQRNIAEMKDYGPVIAHNLHDLPVCMNYYSPCCLQIRDVFRCRSSPFASQPFGLYVHDVHSSSGKPWLARYKLYFQALVTFPYAQSYTRER
jgi:hypothetical protein